MAKTRQAQMIWSAQPFDRSEMKRTRLAPVVLFWLAIAACSAPVEEVPPGAERLYAWTNVKVSESDDPHAYGIEVELWRHNGELSGFLQEYVGPAFDPPAGRLEAIQFDEKTGNISFTAKLSTGVVSSNTTEQWVPSKDLYEFQGVVGKGTVAGTLRRKQIQGDGKTTSNDEMIVLEETSDAAGSYDEWLESWNEALEDRGPKW